MTDFIKLTRKDSSAMMVNIDRLVAFVPGNENGTNHTILFLEGGGRQFVLETFDEVFRKVNR